MNTFKCLFDWDDNNSRALRSTTLDVLKGKVVDGNIVKSVLDVYSIVMYRVSQDVLLLLVR
jgi:hypothetical protein